MTFMRQWNVLFSLLLTFGLHAQTANFPESSLNPYYAVDSGAANVMVVTTQGCPSSLLEGSLIRVKPNNANSTTTPTLNVCGLGAKTIVKLAGVPLVAGDIATAAIAEMVYDGTNFQLLNPQVASGGGNTTSTSLTSNVISKANGANSIVNSLVTDDGTTETYTGTGGVAAPAFTGTGTTAGFIDYGQGSTSAAVAPCNTLNSWCVQAPASLSSNFIETLPTPSTGLMLHTLSGSTITDTIVAAPTGAIVGTTDTQTLSGKSIAASEVNSGSYQILPSLMTAQVVTADVTCGTGGTISTCTTAKTITGLSFTLPAVAASYSFECFLIVGQATAATANQWLVQTATNGATNMMLAADIRTATGTSALLVTTGQASTTTAVEIGGATWTLAATGTKMLHRLYGTIEGASSSGSTLNFQVIAPTVADLLTIYRGSTCRIF